MAEFDYGNFKVVEVQTDPDDRFRYEIWYFGGYLLGPTTFTAAALLARRLHRLAQDQGKADNEALPKPTRKRRSRNGS